MTRQKPRTRPFNKGVHPFSINKNAHSYWRAVLPVNGKVETIGYYKQFRDAVIAYVSAHVELYGERPDSLYQNPETGKAVRIPRCGKRN